MEWWQIVLVAVVAVSTAGAFFIKSPTCSVCEKPIYSTKSGWRHKPGHAPSDGHKAAKKE